MRWLAVLLLLAVGCAYSQITVNLDDQGEPQTIARNANLMRIGTTAQVVTYDPRTQVVAITQVTAADSMSDNLTAAWSRLMDIAGYALGGATIAAAAGGPTTPAAVAGGLIGYIKGEITKDQPEPEAQEEETP